MHCINSNIASIQAVLQHLSFERSSLETSINSHVSLLSPIRRLPNELLSEIFLSREHNVLLSANPTSRPLTNLLDDTLWHIIQVCALWRSIAFSTPSLWNWLLIDLTFLKDSPINYACLQMRLQICLSHSAALPLNFGVIGTHRQEPANLMPLMTTLCSHSHRWANVYFCPYATNILASRLLASNQHLSTSQLVSLGLTSFNPSPGFIQISPTQFNHTPSLTRLALHDYRGQTNSATSSPSSLPSFCRYLTHLYLNSCPYYTYDDILSHVPSLTHLETFNKYQHSARSPNITPIHLPNLIAFKTTGWLNNLCFLLPHLQIPSIRQIDIVILEEECHPCTCGIVKRRIINEWIQTLGEGVQVAVVDAPGEDDVRTSADHNIITFLFSDI